tara:strand:- start:2515 stop:3240 length:726 start_codon:yes stop_codon:yes gene_type:complete
MTSAFNYNLNINGNRPIIVFCIPGNTFTNNFLASWTDTVSTLSSKYSIFFVNKFSSQVNFARALCLGADVLNGPDQKPFGGKLKYDAIIWLDSDMVFNPTIIEKLINMTLYKYKICSGIYAMDGGTQLCCVKNWDIDYYKKNGSFEFLSNDDANDLIKHNRNILNCAYVGMGCMGIRNGVIEDPRFKYPWFFRNITHISENVVDGTSEDVSFIRNLIESGVVDSIPVDLSLRFGHEKRIIY